MKYFLRKTVALALIGVGLQVIARADAIETSENAVVFLKAPPKQVLEQRSSNSPLYAMVGGERFGGVYI
jgi:hypothetical protein